MATLLHVGAAAPGMGPVAPAEKSDANLVAEFALAGVELVKLADGTWLASRWGMFKPLTTEADARAWLSRVRGRAA